MLSVYKTFTLRYNKVVFIYKSPVKWGVQIVGMIFQTSSSAQAMDFSSHNADLRGLRISKMPVKCFIDYELSNSNAKRILN